MILYQGQLYSDEKQESLLESLYSDCLSTISNDEPLTTDMVINACDSLYKKIINHDFDYLVLPLLKTFDISEEYYLETIKMFSKDGLLTKVKIELGKDFNNLPNIGKNTRRKYVPLGILLHISAGNVDVLPAYSVIEGLLAGNINILKLPTGDTGVSIKLLNELIKVEPKLKNYIYVFDIPSTELESMQKLMNMVNGIVIWGGDKANEAVRQNAPITAKIISWGHKLSFAYVTKNYDVEDLKALADHICTTNQTLCSSCQGLYFDSDNEEELVKFAKLFFEELKLANRRIGKENIGAIGRNTFQLYSKSLEESDDVIFNEDGVSVVVKHGQELELSYMFRNVWVKALPHNQIVKALHHNKDHLQSVALLCGDEEKEKIANLLIRAGVTRISNDNPSRTILGEAHDGEYALQRYSKVVEID